MITLRIFLASPGDVTAERDVTRDVISRVGAERRFRDAVNLQIIAWDQPGVSVAMEAGLTPQEAIAQGLPNPADCDLTVVILWSRMGTPLPEEYTKTDGTRYRSGTEWEYINAIKGRDPESQSAVWLYHRTEKPVVALDDDDLEDKRWQLQEVASFLNELNNSDGSINSGVNPYTSIEDFRTQFESHLRDFLESRVARAIDSAAEVPVDKSGAASVEVSGSSAALESTGMNEQQMIKLMTSATACIAVLMLVSVVTLLVVMDKLPVEALIGTKAFGLTGGIASLLAVPYFMLGTNK